MILGRYLITELGLNFKLSNQIIEADDGHFKGYMSPMVDLGMYEFKYFETGKLHPNNILRALTQIKYMNLKMYVLLLNNFMSYKMPNTKRKIYIR